VETLVRWNEDKGCACLGLCTLLVGAASAASAVSALAGAAVPVSGAVLVEALLAVPAACRVAAAQGQRSTSAPC
jgi:hypothetical protein